MRRPWWRSVLFPDPTDTSATTGMAAAFGLTVAGVLVQGLVRFGYTVLVVRVLGVEANGQVAFLLSVAGLLVLLWPQAAGAAAAKFIAMARGREDLPGAAAVAAHTAATTSAAVAALSMIAAGWVAATGAGAAPALTGAALVASWAGYTFARGVRTGRGQFLTNTAWDGLSATLALGLLALVLAGRWEPVLLVPLCVGYLVFALPGWPLRGPRLPAQQRQEIRRFTAWTSVQLIAATGLLQVSVVAARATDTLQALGLYGIAVAVATPASMLSGAMLSALAPTVASRHAAGDHPGVVAAVDAVMRVMITVFLPVFGLLILWSHPVLAVLFGPVATQARGLLVVLLLAVSVSSFNAANLRLSATQAWGVRALAMSHVAGFSVGVVVVVTAGAHWGVMGSALGYLVGSVVSAIGPLVIVWRADAMSWWPLVGRVLAGYAMILGLSWWTGPTFGLGPAVGATVVFLLVWAGLCRRDLTMIVSRLWRW